MLVLSDTAAAVSGLSVVVTVVAECFSFVTLNGALALGTPAACCFLNESIISLHASSFFLSVEADAGVKGAFLDVVVLNAPVLKGVPAAFRFVFVFFFAVLVIVATDDAFDELADVATCAFAADDASVGKGFPNARGSFFDSARESVLSMPSLFPAVSDVAFFELTAADAAAVSFDIAFNCPFSKTMPNAMRCLSRSYFGVEASGNDAAYFIGCPYASMWSPFDSFSMDSFV